MFLTQKRNTPAVQILIGCAIASMFLLAMVLRVSLYPIETSDYTVFLSSWYDFIQGHGGFAALKYNFSNYNTPYLYLLTIATYLPIVKIVAIKTISVVFDIVLGLFVYLIIRLKYRRTYAAIVGALVVFFAPTIFINSAAWGQSDAIYTAFCLGSLYFLLKERPVWVCVFFGLAISFKLQAIFFLPVLLIFFLRRKSQLKYLILIPAIFLLLLAPAYIAGRDAWSLLTIYAGQINNDGAGGGAGQFNAGGAGNPFNGRGTGQFNRGGTGNQFNGRGTGQFNRGGAGNPFNGGRQRGGGFSRSTLTLNAPSVYQWFPADAAAYWKWVGIFLAGLVVALVGVLVIKSKEKLSADILLKVALVFALAIPFLLPEMHERYFYIADVVSIIFAFYFPRYFYIAVVMQLCSLLSYTPYLLGTQIVDLSIVAFAVLVIAIIAAVELVLTLFPNLRKSAAAPVVPVEVEAVVATMGAEKSRASE